MGGGLGMEGGRGGGGMYGILDRVVTGLLR